MYRLWLMLNETPKGHGAFCFNDWKQERGRGIPLNGRHPINPMQWPFNTDFLCCMRELWQPTRRWFACYMCRGRAICPISTGSYQQPKHANFRVGGLMCIQVINMVQRPSGGVCMDSCVYMARTLPSHKNQTGFSTWSSQENLRKLKDAWSMNVLTCMHKYYRVGPSVTLAVLVHPCLKSQAARPFRKKIN